MNWLEIVILSPRNIKIRTKLTVAEEYPHPQEPVMDV